VRACLPHAYPCKGGCPGVGVVGGLVCMPVLLLFVRACLKEMYNFRSHHRSCAVLYKVLCYTSTASFRYVMHAAWPLTGEDIVHLWLGRSCYAEEHTRECARTVPRARAARAHARTHARMCVRVLQCALTVCHRPPHRGLVIHVATDR
jgi:hypothetical protein